jgi:transcriptional regulator with XRE-family HTH domain
VTAQPLTPLHYPGSDEDAEDVYQLLLFLRQYRESVGISQRAASEFAGFTNATWSNLEKRRYDSVKLDYLQAAFRALGKRLKITVEDIS